MKRRRAAALRPPREACAPARAEMQLRQIAAARTRAWSSPAARGQPAARHRAPRWRSSGSTDRRDARPARVRPRPSSRSKRHERQCRPRARADRPPTRRTAAGPPPAARTRASRAPVRAQQPPGEARRLRSAVAQVRGSRRMVPQAISLHSLYSINIYGSRCARMIEPGSRAGALRWGAGARKVFGRRTGGPFP